MLKRVLLAMAPVVMLTANLTADDDFVSELATVKADTIADASIEIEEFDLDVDVDKLADEAGSEQSDDAIEACFRRFGYRYHGGWGYGYRNYHCYRPVYNYYSCYRTYFCRPVYHHVYPVVRYYWGCH